MTNFQVRPTILWCLRIILILQTAFFMLPLPEKNFLPAPLNSILLPALLCFAFAAGVCIPWKNKWYFIFDLLLPAAAIFLFPGRAFFIFFCAGSLLHIELIEDADMPISISCFTSSFCWGTGVFLCVYWMFGNLICWLIPLILLIITIFCNHFSYIRETRFAAALPFLAMFAGIWLVYPQIAEQDVDSRENILFANDPVSGPEIADSEMLPLLAMQVFTDHEKYFCADRNSYSSGLFRSFPGTVFCETRNITPVVNRDCGLYYYELPLPRNLKGNFYFTRAFYESVLASATHKDALLAVRVPIPRDDPREAQIAAVIAAAMPGKTAQLYGPHFRYLVVKKDGGLPDLSPEHFAERIMQDNKDGALNRDFTAGYAALQFKEYTDLPEWEHINTQEDPQLLRTLGIDVEDHGMQWERIRDFLTRYLVWCFAALLVIYLLCRYFINWSPRHKPVFHFIEKGIYCGGAIACFFSDWWSASAALQKNFFLLAGIILLLFHAIARIRSRFIKGVVLILSFALFFRYGFIAPWSLLVFFMMCGLLVMDHISLRDRFFLREEDLPYFYCISLFTGAASFAGITFFLHLFAGLTLILTGCLGLLMLCHGFCSYRASAGKAQKTS